VACDSRTSLPDKLVKNINNVEVYRNSHNDKYIDLLIHSELVVITLNNNNISSGQMVLLHAMAYRKPIIISQNRTISDYTHDTKCVKFVPLFNSDALANEINNLMKSPDIRKNLANNAGLTYDKYHSLQQFAHAYFNFIKSNYG